MLLNAILALFTIYLTYKKPLAIRFDFQKKTTGSKIGDCELGNIEEIKNLQLLDFKGLASMLTEERGFELIEHGYRRRDLALSCLALRHFDVARALGRSPERATLSYKKSKLPLYPSLGDEDFERISRFIAEERYPLTARGLLVALKRLEKADREKSKGVKRDLAATLYLTDEFQLVFQLFQRAGTKIGKGAVAELLIEGPWELVDNFCRDQRQSHDLSQESLRSFLHSYLNARSKSSALLLVLLDYSHTVNRLDDRTLVQILSLLPAEGKLVQSFSKALANSPRGSSVKELAKRKLGLEAEGSPSGELAQKPGPRPSVGELRPHFRERPPAAPAPFIHIVERGETLATISTKYRVSQDFLMEFNHLPTSNLKPGMTLKVPRR